MVERRDVSLSVPEVTRLKKTPQVIQRAAGFKGVAAPGDNILASLAQASGIGLETAKKSLDLKVQKDRVKQASNFMMGEQPSDDATVAGYHAHALLAMQNKVQTNALTLKEEAETFAGSDQEWNDLVLNKRQESMKELRDAYPNLHEDSVDFQRNLTNMFVNEMPGVTAARIAGKLNIEAEKRLNTFNDDLINRMQVFDPAEGYDGLITAINETKTAMQISSEDADASIVQQALTAAIDGDGRLIEFAKQYTGGRDSSLFERTPELHKAEQAIAKGNIVKNEVAAGLQKADILTKFELSGDREYLMEADKKMRAATGIGFSNAEIKAAVLGRSKKIIKNQTKTDIANIFLQEAGAPGNLKLMDKNYSKEQINEGLQYAREQLDQMTESLIKTQGLDEEQAQVLRTGTDVRFARNLTEQGVTYKPWTDKITRLKTISQANLDKIDVLPPEMQSIYALWETLPPNTRGVMAATDEDKSFMNNIGYFMDAHYTGPQALMAAQAAMRGKSKMVGDKLSTMHKEVSKVVKDVTTKWFGKDMPEKGLEGASEWITQRTYAMAAAGAVDMESAAKEAGQLYLEQSTELSDGTRVNGTAHYLASRIGNTNFLDVPLTFDSYTWNNKEGIIRAGGDPDDVSYRVNENTGMFQIIDSDGVTPLTTLTPLSELKNGRDEYLLRDEKPDVDKVPMAILDAGRMKGQTPEETAEQYFKDIGIQRKEEQDEMRNVDVLPQSILLEANHPTTGSEFQMGIMHEPTQEIKQMPEPLKAEPLKESFSQALMKVENGIKKGFDKETGLWESYEDNKKTAIGYGHELTSAEVKSGQILIGGVPYKYKKGESEITDSLMNKLFIEDMRRHEGTINKAWNYEQLPLRYKMVLLNLSYNIGSVSPTKWPKLQKAMAKGDDATVAKEMITKAKFRDRETGGWTYKRLTSRANHIAKALGLIGE
jgi:hypothetical protein